MSVALDLPVPVRSRWAQVPGVLAAIAGRFGWRLWWPLVTWLVAAFFAWVGAINRVLAPGDGGVWNTSASGVLLLAGVLAIPVLWVWGSRYALGLGHDRGVVFGVTVAVSLLLQVASHLVSLTAALTEHRLVGMDGIHVFALETMDKFGTWGTVWNSSWVFGLWYVLPVLVLLVPVAVGVARWGALGLLGVLAIPLALAAAFGLLVLGSPAAPQASFFGVHAALIVGALVAAWFIFRRVPV